MNNITVEQRIISLTPKNSKFYLNGKKALVALLDQEINFSLVSYHHLKHLTPFLSKYYNDDQIRKGYRDYLMNKDRYGFSFHETNYFSKIIDVFRIAEEDNVDINDLKNYLIRIPRKNLKTFFKLHNNTIIKHNYETQQEHYNNPNTGTRSCRLNINNVNIINIKDSLIQEINNTIDNSKNRFDSLEIILNTVYNQLVDFSKRKKLGHTKIFYKFISLLLLKVNIDLNKRHDTHKVIQLTQIQKELLNKKK